MSATNEVATNFEVVKHQGKYLCVCTYNGRRYCFNNAYDIEEQAFRVIHMLGTRYHTNTSYLNGNYSIYQPRYQYEFEQWQNSFERYHIVNGIAPNLQQ